MIQSKHIHPAYDSPDRANDVALLRLREPAMMGDTVSPACLPEQGDFGDQSSFPEGDAVDINENQNLEDVMISGMKCILSGWGRHGTDEHIPGDLYGQPWTLRQATLPLMSDEECRAIYQVSAVSL